MCSTGPKCERCFRSDCEIAGAFVTRLLKFAESSSDFPRRFIYERDEDDEPYINLAIEVGASS